MTDSINQRPDWESDPDPSDQKSKKSETKPAVDPRDLVYTSPYSKDLGSVSDNPREIINNPAVAPQMHTLNDTSENLRDDMFRETDGE